ncbi:MAG: hypothetical protein ABSD21_01395 [Rhizomicrobium sp.]|jgi:hypothetical protein
MRGTNITFLSAILFAAATLPAGAQTTSYNVKTMDFDLWCTEQAHLPYERCDKRLPDDLQKFEAYRAIVEKYEIPYLQEKEQKLRLDRDILHNDPIDKGPAQKADVTKATDGKSP